MPVGGAETLLVNLLRRFNRGRIDPEVVCLKEPGPLGEEIARELPLYSNLLNSKFDLRILPRLIRHFHRNRVQAVVTVGAGDKMFWGRLAAYLAGVPVIASALHSTGWPDGVGRMNRWLTPVTDAFIAVAKSHGDFLVNFERFPASKVAVISNGIDTNRFVPNETTRLSVREELGIPGEAPLLGIVAALRPEKNHEMFVEMGKRLLQTVPEAHFMIIGDGPQRPAIEQLIRTHGLDSRFHLLGVRGDTERLLTSLDVFCLTSHNEANPVSILEALSCEVPVVATDVGSISETVLPGETDYLTPANEPIAFANRVAELLANGSFAKNCGANGRRRVIRTSSLEAMVAGYEDLLHGIYERKSKGSAILGTRNRKSDASPTCQ